MVAFSLRHARTCTLLLVVVVVFSPGSVSCQAPLLPPYNYMVGTQSMGALYRFLSNESLLQETAGVIANMGSNIMKYKYEDDIHFDVTKREFGFIFLSFRSNSKLWFDGMTAYEKQEEYTAVFNLANKLLTTFENTSRTFLIGHEDGDWLLIPSQNPFIQPSAQAVQGMIEWLKVRQSAIDDARSKNPNSGVHIYHYTEANRVQDAMVGYNRLANVVLPYVSVDLVSYSIEEEVQSQLPSTVTPLLDYLFSQLPPKIGIPGKRVFVGQFGIPQCDASNNEMEHKRRNLDLLSQLLMWNPDFVLYYQLYNSKLDGQGNQMGYWLINNKNHKLPLYNAFQMVLEDAKVWVNSYVERYGHIPDPISYSSWLCDLIQSL